MQLLKHGAYRFRFLIRENGVLLCQRGMAQIGFVPKGYTNWSKDSLFGALCVPNAKLWHSTDSKGFCNSDKQVTETVTALRLSERM